MAYIETVDYEDAEGKLKEVYDHLIQTRGKLAELHKIQSLDPEGVIRHMDLYVHLMYGKSPLKREQREMIGVVVSICNSCMYCVKHHSEALNHFWKDNKRLGLFLRDYTKAGLSDQDLLLCLLSEQLTIKPAFSGKEELIRRIKDNGLGDRAVLDAHMIISYFNFVNRLVVGLGVDGDASENSGYQYD